MSAGTESQSFRMVDAPRVPIEKQIFASAAGSATALMLLNPAGVVKIRIQQHDQCKLAIARAASHVMRNNGFFGFWAGARTGLIGTLPSTVLYMTSYEAMKGALVDKMDSSQRNGGRFARLAMPYSASMAWLIPGAAAAAARTLSAVLMSPLELMRTIQSSGRKESLSTIAQELHRKEGPKGFYRGLGATLARDVPFSAIFWACLESSKAPLERSVLSWAENNALLAAKGHEQRKSFAQYASRLLGGAFAGFVSSVFTHPFDVIKTRRQLHGMSTESVTDAALPTSVSALLRKDGLKGLSRGMGLRLATVIPGGAIMVTVYDTARRL